MKNKLCEIMKAQELCAIHANAENISKFSVGYVIAVDDEYYVVEAFDPLGAKDGLYCAYIEGVIEVKTGTKYLNSIKKIIQKKNTVRKLDIVLECDLLYQFLELAQTKKRICEIEFCDSGFKDISGRIKSIDKNRAVCELTNYDTDGELDGESIVNIPDISYVSFDSQDTQKLEFLSE